MVGGEQVSLCERLVNKTSEAISKFGTISSIQNAEIGLIMRPTLSPLNQFLIAEIFRNEISYIEGYSHF